METLLYYSAPEFRALADVATSYRFSFQPTIETAPFVQNILHENTVKAVSKYPVERMLEPDPGKIGLSQPPEGCCYGPAE